MNKKLSLIFIVMSLFATPCFAKNVSGNLEQKSINYNGMQYPTDTITYKGATYVPLRQFSNILGENIVYQNGIFYLGNSFPQSSNTTQQQTRNTSREYAYSINNARITTKTGEDTRILVVDISFTNNSGESIAQISTLDSITAYQDGVQLKTTFDLDISEQTTFTKVQTGNTTNIVCMFEIRNESSPITIEITGVFDDFKTSKTFSF